MASVREKNGRFGKGNRTGGRPAGAKNRFTTVKESFLEVFEELNPDGKAHLLTWARENPGDFYRLAARLLPREIDAKVQMAVQSADVPPRPVTIEEWLERGKAGLYDADFDGSGDD